MFRYLRFKAWLYHKRKLREEELSHERKKQLIETLKGTENKSLPDFRTSELL